MREVGQLMTSPQWIGTREHAFSCLRKFLPGISQYAARRNYALPGSKGVSRLSPYLRHRLISEEEVITAATAEVDFSDAEKFIQEVVWRTYWKGALQLNPAVWYSFEKRCNELATSEMSAPWIELYEAARAGTTHLSYFNDWVHELISTGYLHNHVRMWFASIWVFTFKIPWQLGAAFMYHHLLDGDPASNTLSWRWVAGLHTKGKTYLARADNIAKYSEGRWVPREGDLAAEAFRIEDDIKQESRTHRKLSALPGSEATGLVVTTDDLSIETFLDVRRYASICLYDPIEPEQTKVKRTFLHQAAQDLQSRLAALRGEDSLSIARSLSDIVAWRESKKASGVVLVQPQVGHLSTSLAELPEVLGATGASVGLVQRTWDANLFPLCDKGFFTLWERFKKKCERGELL